MLSQSVKFGRRYLGAASVMFSQKVLDTLLEVKLSELKQRVLELTLAVIILRPGLVASRGAFLDVSDRARHRRQRAGSGRAIGMLIWAAPKNGPMSWGFFRGPSARWRGNSRSWTSSKEDFVSAVTHELRSPLGAIECFLKIEDERRQGRPATQWEDYHRRMTQNVHRLGKFVTDLLDVAALDRGKVQLEPEVVDAAALARETVAL